MKENELLEMLAEELTYPDIEENEVTAEMLGKRLGIAKRYANEKLLTKYNNGLLTRRRVKGKDGRPQYAYSKP